MKLLKKFISIFSVVPTAGWLLGVFAAVLAEYFLGDLVSYYLYLPKIPVLLGTLVMLKEPTLIPSVIGYDILIYVIPVCLVALISAPLMNRVAAFLEKTPVWLATLIHLVAFYGILHMWAGINDYRVIVIKFTLISIILTISLNIINGYQGEFSCSHPGFMALGAYASSTLTLLLFTNDKMFGEALLPPALGPWCFPLVLIIGGFVAYWFLSPLLSAMGAFPMDAAGESINQPGPLRLLLYRPFGIGMLIGGAIMGVILASPLIVSAVKSMQKAAQVETGASKDEMPIKLLYFAVGGALILLCYMAISSVESVGLVQGIAMALLGTLWIWMAGIILSEAIGRTNWSPLSGMTLVGITLLIILTQAFGMERSDSIIAALMVGAAMCVAMSQATDLMLDLKTGYLVGATPRMQQIGQFAGAWLGPIVVIGVIFVLNESHGLGSDKLPAPQAQALASTIDGIMGGDVPTQKYAAGAVMGGILSAMMGGLGITVGLGFYLPFNIVLTYSLGTLGRELSDRIKGQTWSEEVGIPIAAGLIVGEALVGVGDALSIVLSG